MKDPIYAAGTVPWRRVTKKDGSKAIEILLVYRKKYRDWSFPKGKVDPGETLPQAAVRETREETHLDVTLGANLGTLNYTLSSGREKIVQYWAAKVRRKVWRSYDFRGNSEIEKVKWVKLSRAFTKLSYGRDRELLKVFRDLVRNDRLDTYNVILLRHATAMPRGKDFPVDHLRPLAQHGFGQAQAIIPTLSAFGPTRIYTSDAERCRTTVDPFSTRQKVEVKLDHGLSQDAWDEGDLDGLRDRIDAVIRRRDNVILCSHRPVLPDIARELSLAAGSESGPYLTDAAKLPPAGFSVFHLSKKHPYRGVVSVEVYPLELTKNI